MSHGPDKIQSERPSEGHGIVIVKGWDRTPEMLKSTYGLEEQVNEMGFTIEDLTNLLNRDFPESMAVESVRNSRGEVVDNVATEILTVGGRLLDRALVVAYPSAANEDLKEMTQFKSGGEVILMLDGSAELTYAREVVDGAIPRSSLKGEKLESGDLVISTNTPNNWTKVYGDKFRFVYFVGNPDGPQSYGDIPKEELPIV